MRDVAAYVIATDRSARVPAVYLSKDLGTGKSVQWKFHLVKNQREDLWQRTQYFDADTFNAERYPVRQSARARHEQSTPERPARSGPLLDRLRRQGRRGRTKLPRFCGRN